MFFFLGYFWLFYCCRSHGGSEHFGLCEISFTVSFARILPTYGITLKFTLHFFDSLAFFFSSLALLYRTFVIRGRCWAGRKHHRIAKKKNILKKTAKSKSTLYWIEKIEKRKLRMQPWHEGWTRNQCIFAHIST